MTPTNKHKQIIKFVEGPNHNHLSVLEVYKRNTQEIVRRFLDHRITFAGCMAALDAAFGVLLPKLKPEQLPDVRTVVLANNERVMAEMHKRERKRKTNAKSRAMANKRHAAKLSHSFTRRVLRAQER